MKTFACTQYSPDWWTVRNGMPTASEFDKLVTPAKWAKSTSWTKYICALAADVANQSPNFFTEREDRPKSQAMADGRNYEPEARRAYAMVRDIDVSEIGFCLSDCNRFGCSPDGLIDDSPEGAGSLELKCPVLATQIGYLLEGGLPTEYKPQVHGQLIVTGRPWVDFMSYAVGVPPVLVRVTPTKDTITLKAILEDFLGEYERILKVLGLEERKAMYDKGRAEWSPAT